MPGQTADLYLTVPLKKRTPVELAVDGADTLESDLTHDTTYSAAIEVSDPELILTLAQASIRRNLDAFIELLPEEITAEYDPQLHETSVDFLPPDTAVICAAAIHCNSSAISHDMYTVLNIWGKSRTFFGDQILNNARTTYHRHIENDTPLPPGEKQDTINWLEETLS